MGLSCESCSDNGKSNKVTQCPKLKVFKLMEQKDLDSEKIKLLKQKNKEKKTKYSESRSKIAQELYDSSSTERFQQPRRKSSTAVQDKERFDYGHQGVFETYDGETKNGWYRDRQDKLKVSPSRVSCALKKLLGSEYACAVCFSLIFLVTVVVGLLLVFKVMSSSSDMTEDDDVHRAKGKRQSDDYDIFGGRRYIGKSIDGSYQFPSYSATTGKNEFGYTDLSDQSFNDDITNIMNGAEIMDSDNEKLRDFYKKLIETDAEIKRVKQNLQFNIRKYDNQELERIKRSLKKTQSGAVKQRLHQGNKRQNMKSKLRSNRQNINGTDDGYGIVIQEQEVIVYKPKKSGYINDRKFPKKHYKHLFYKQKQKIDRENKTLKNNFKILEEEKNHFNNTEIITAKYDGDNIGNNVQKDNNINVPFKSNNNVDMIYLPSFESLNILSNITTLMNKGENMSQNSKNVNHLRRNIYTGNNKYEDKLPKELSRKGRSLMSFEEEHSFTKTESAGVNKNHYDHTNETDYGNNEYRLKRLLQYKTSGSNSITASNLNTLINLTQFDIIASSTQGISSVGNFNENTKKEIVHNVINKISRHIEDSNFTTKSLTKRAEVKREADNKLVFWDSVYNDSAKNYLDGKKRSGGCIKKSKVQKSKDWFKSQMHHLIGRRKKSNKIKKNYSNDGSSKKEVHWDESFQSIPNWRKIRTLQHDNVKDMDNIFKKLNAKMETICREAAYAIQNTKNIKVRESKADIATSTLMQRLVRMMRDLVDMQVQEKTCVELPPDLRQFLEWLVPPPEANPQADDLNPDISDYVAIKKEFDGIDKSDDVTNQPLSFTEDTDEAEVDKIQCMETIRAVQDLVNQYEGLSSDDKYKLSGVRDYLQRQLQYLNKLVGVIDTENYLQESDDRVKRETNKNKTKLDKRTRNSRFGYYIQRLRIKHTIATTQAINTSFSNNVTVKDKEIFSYTGHTLKNTSNVYNRALEEAKSLTTEDVYTIIT